jgi:hypothetical protein
MPTPGTTLSALRLAIGVSAWAAPNVTGKVFGLDPVANPQAAYLARLFGVRDVALAGFAKGADAESRPLAWQLGIASDLLDGVAAVLGARNGTLSKQTAIMAGGTALVAAGLGAAALQAGE